MPRTSGASFRSCGPAPGQRGQSHGKELYIRIAMRHYELMVIVHPDVAEDGLAATVDAIREWASAAGEVEKIDSWGRRKFAYPIRNLQEGNYILLHLRLEPSAVLELERNLRLSEEVLRHLLVRLDE